MHETLDEKGDRRFLIQTTAHQVVKLVGVDRGACSTVSSSNFVSEHFQLGNGFCPSLFGKQEVLEHLTCIATFGDGQQPGANRMTLVIAGGMNVEG